jgi:hypothetical protein
MNLDYTRIRNLKEEINELLINSNGNFILKDHQNLIEKAKQLNIDENKLLMIVLELESQIDWQEIENIKKITIEKNKKEQTTIEFNEKIATEKKKTIEIEQKNSEIGIKLVSALCLFSYIMIGVTPYFFAENYEKYLNSYIIITITHIPLIYYCSKILIKNKFSNYTVAKISYLIFLFKMLNSISFLIKIQEEIEKSRNLVFDTKYFDIVILFQYLFFITFIIFTICFRRSYNRGKRNNDITFTINFN